MNKESLKLALAQINPTVGDVNGNVQLILDAAYAAHAHGAQLVVLPECALSGYPAEDLLLRRDFLEAVDQGVKALCSANLPIALLIGHPRFADGQCFNSASLIEHQKIIFQYDKRQLPNTGVFDECRYFTAGTGSGLMHFKGYTLAICICEDLWQNDPRLETDAHQADMMISLNASPYSLGKHTERVDLLSERAAHWQIPIAYVNCVGGQDELVFDGRSMWIGRDGRILDVYDSPSSAQLFAQLSIEDNNFPKLLPQRSRNQLNSAESDTIAHLYSILCLGLRDYVHKSGFEDVLVAVSGGIDSALTWALAVDSFGPKHVHPVYLPSQYSSALSTQAVKEQAEHTQTKLQTYDLQIPLQATISTLNQTLNRVADQNLQARLRGVLMMTLSNQMGALVLNTSNKSELAAGYSTLYGDMVGAFGPLKDVNKGRVYTLANWRNTQSLIIPEIVLTRAPSAELAADQTDQDTLPAYDVLDQIIAGLIEDNLSPNELIKAGCPIDATHTMCHRIGLNEHKRHQAPPGIRITQRAFGKDWRFPIVNGFRYTLDE